jgi:hypothetical protein
MRKFVGIALFLGIFSLAAFAQESGSAPKAEFSGGYQYTRWFGVAADFSGAYKSQNGVSFNNYTYTFGPVISYRHNEAFTPFAHFLAGGVRSSAAFSGVSASDNGFAMMFGGGVDVKATRRIAVRAIQFDWLSLHSNGVTDNNNMRISTGLLFRY